MGADGDGSSVWPAPVPSLSIGSHTFTLEVTDGAVTRLRHDALTVANTPPDAQPTPTSSRLRSVWMQSSSERPWRTSMATR